MSQYFKFTGLAKRQEYWAVIIQELTDD